MGKASAVSFFLFAGVSSVFGGGFSLGSSLGTTGLGPQAAFSMSRFFTFRTAVEFMPLDVTVASEGLRYDMELDQVWLPILLDYSVGGSVFRTTAGLFLNLDGINASYSPESNVQVGQNTYTPQQLGTIEGDINFSPISPYLGIGLGVPVSGSPGLSVCLDGGVLFSSFSCNLRNLGGEIPVGLVEVLEENLQMAADSLESKLGLLKTYPRLSVCLLYSF